MKSADAMTDIGLHAFNCCYTVEHVMHTHVLVSMFLICLIVVMNVDRVNVSRARAFDYVASHIYYTMYTYRCMTMMVCLL